MLSILRPILVGVALAIGMAGGQAAHAEVNSVPCDVPTLIGVLTNANYNGEEDLIWLAPSCVYVMPETWLIEVDLGSPVRIYGKGATLSGEDQRSVFLVKPGATLHLNDVTVTDGSTTGNGGAIRNDGTLTLTDSIVSGSSAPQGYGAGIYNAGTLRLRRSTLSGNTGAVQAGGINNAVAGRLTLTDSTVSGNAGLYGGGIHNAGRAALFNSTLFGNGAFVGGGIENRNVGKLFLSNVTISENAISGSNGGGGIRNEGALEIDNSIIANHLSVYADCFNSGTITTSTSNLIEDGSCSFVGVATGDPMLGSPIGTPAYLPLLAGSSAIDAGQNPHCPGADQRGAPRPHDGNTDGWVICDLGAYEAHPPGVGCGLFGIEICLVLPLLRRLVAVG